MRRFFESIEQLAFDVIMERRGGKRAAVLRAILYQASRLYRKIVEARLFFIALIFCDNIS